MRFVQLWVYLSSSPLFGLTATLLTYVTCSAVYDRVGRAPVGQPRAVVGAGAGGGARADRHGLPRVLRRRAVRARAARSRGGRARLAAVGAARRGAPAWRGAHPRGAGRRPRRGGQRGGDGVGRGPAGGGDPVARAEVGHRAGGDGHRRPHRWRAGAGRRVRGGDRPRGGAHGPLPVHAAAHRVDGRAAASRSAPRRMASARRGQCRCTPTPGRMLGSRWACRSCSPRC